jgi:EAL domain-containing protein (putative c-di-GMP-specific phosphodiesterase class I)
MKAPEDSAPGDDTQPGWRFLCLVEISNFSQLRRQVGTARADRLAIELARRIALLLPAADLAVIGRAALEISFEGASFDELHETLARLAAELEPPSADGKRLELVLAGAGAPTGSFDDLGLAEELDEAAALARCERRIVVRDVSAAAPALDRLSLSRDLAGAIERGEMFLHYQPKVHVRQQKVTGVEALIRWHHSVRGLILPGDFIPAAEEAGAIVDLTLWTLEQVIVDQRRLAELGHDLEIFVNISGQLLADAAFVARACELVRDTHGRIGFEITETSVIRDPDTAIAHLKQIAQIGVPIAIDDYGAGLSSLAYLKQLPARELKIDKMFVTQLTSSNRDPLIVRSTIDLAHALEMEVTAEGVETQAALALLSVMGCDMVQGFLISRPVSFDALVGFLEEDQHIARAEPLRGSFNQPASFWKSA